MIPSKLLEKTLQIVKL